MMDWDATGRRKIPYPARRSVVMTCVLALFVLALSPGLVEATMIIDGPRRAYFDPRGPFLFQLTLSRVDVNANACTRPPLPIDAGSYSKNRERPSESAENGAGIKNAAFPPAGRLSRNRDSRPWSVLGGNSSGLDRMVWELDGLGPDARLAMGTISELGRIKTRVASLGSCLKYMQYVLKMIGVIFTLPQGKANAVSDGTAGSYANIFAFVVAGSAAADSSDPAGDDSEYALPYELNDPHSAALKVSKGQLTEYSGGTASYGRAGASGPKRRPPRSALSVNQILEKFIIDIFSQAYTYVLIAVFLIFSLFLRSRV